MKIRKLTNQNFFSLNYDIMRMRIYSLLRGRNFFGKPPLKIFQEVKINFWEFMLAYILIINELLTLLLLYGYF